MPYASRLYARPTAVASPAPTGTHRLPHGDRRDSWFHVPPGYCVDRPCGLILLLHGAGGHAQHGLDLVLPLADEAGAILVAPASSGHSWDVIVDRMYGPDVAVIDQALEHVVNRYAVDPARVAAGGFSDGASYALALGLANGDLFRRIVAFSPGYVPALEPVGRPAVFISHGTADAVLPVAQCSRRIVPMLREAGYAVDYREFDGGHEVPPAIARAAVEWLRTEVGGNAG